MAGELRATLLTTVKGDAIKKLQKDLGGLGGSLKSIGDAASKVAKGFAGFATAIGATKFITGSIEQAKLLEQSYRSLETVFGPLTGEMQKFAEGATKIGLSQTEAAKASIFIGGVLQQYGVAQDKAAESTQRLVSLAADLSFVYGYDVQEALLGMTALFRGEYDPIEKFGVAMKQNEIESIKAARGLAGLTGAAEMNADVLIRQELLFQRTGKSLGAFTNNADTLAVQSEVLRATFENLQATVGQELSPVITQFFSDLIPIIEGAGPGLIKVIEVVGEVVEQASQIFIDAFDPTSKLGESIARIDIAFQSLIRTMDAEKFNPIVIIFQTLYNVLDLFARAIHDVILGTENLIIEFEAMGRVATALFNQDWEAMSKGWRVLADEAKKARDAANAGKLAFQQLYYEISRNPTDLGDTREIWDIKPKIKLDVDPDPDPDTIKGVKTFFEKLQEEVDKQAARTKLSAMGASAGLIDAILGDGDSWKKTFDSIVKGGIKAVQNAQAIFNRTAAGIKEVEEAAKKAQEQLQKMLESRVESARRRAEATQDIADADYWNTYADAIESGYAREEAIAMAREARAIAAYRRNQELIAQQKELTQAFQQSASAIFGSFRLAGVADEVGTYTQAVRDLRDQLTQLISENAFEGQIGLFKPDVQKNLIESVKNITTMMERVSKARDRMVQELAIAQDALRTQQEGRKSIFESIVDSIMGNVNVAQIGGRSSTIIKSLRRTLDQTLAFSNQLKELRATGLNSNALKQIIDAGAQVGGATAKAILAGGPDAVSEINNLYNEIGSVASTIGEQGASALFDAGLNAAQSLVDGLLSEQSALVAAAEYLANQFQLAFDRTVKKAGVSISTFTPVQMLDPGFANATTKPIYSGGTGGNITININPGLVTDPVGLGREVVNAIQRYENTSGRVFARA